MPDVVTTPAEAEAVAEERAKHWYQGVPRTAWVVLAVAALGWMFDTYDQQLFNLVRSPSVMEMVKPHVAPDQLQGVVREVGGQLTAVFLLGWAAGGFLFGIIGDRIGRTRTMMATILLYAAFTGLNSLAQTPFQYGLCRFLTALGVGGEFAAGAALVAESWPNRSRAMALGSLQALSAVGNIFAALTVLVLSGLSWRWVFAVGAAPAILVFVVLRAVQEPEKWRAARDAARAARAAGESKELGSIGALFADPVLRRNTLAGVLIAMAGVGGAWGVGFFSPDLVRSAFRPMVANSAAVLALPDGSREAAIGKALSQYSSIVFLIQMVGAAIGMYGYAAVSERIGRKPSMAGLFVLAWLSVEATFRYLTDPTSAYVLAFFLGVFSLAPFAAYSVYFPELYPTRLRATGVGFCYNAARILAAFAPMLLGTLAAKYAVQGDPTSGLRTAASIVAFVYVLGLIGLLFAPETRGKPLPE